MKKNIRKGQHFTFQYGSTLIPIYWLAFKDNSFTFQYGSTLINNILVYSALCVPFTFQYGSTLIICGLRLKVSLVALHSNMVLL